MRHASSNVNSAKVLWATLLACCLQAGLMLVVAADKGDFRKEDDHPQMYRDGWGDLHGSWGVRNLPSGVEQRTFSSIPIAEKRSWNNLQGGWGKRNTDDEDEAIQEVSPRLVQHRRSIPVESENDEFNLRDMDKRNWNKFTDGWGKRSKWDNFKGTWGKREPAWSNLKGIWGKRSERKQFFDN